MAGNTTNDLAAPFSSPNWRVVRDAVDEAGDRLRAGAGDDVAAVAIGDQLRALADHPKWEVRKAVAHAVEYLRLETFHAIVGRLTADDNAFVRDAAQRSLTRRSETTRADVLKEEHSDLMIRWLADLERLYGPRARDKAMRVAERFAELLVREAYHEIVKVVTPLDLALINVETGLGQTKIERRACLDHVKVARERLRFLTSIVDSLRAMTTEVVPQFDAVTLQELLQEAVALVRAKMGLGEEAIAVGLAIDDPLVIDADRHRLLQAILNILQNAFEAFAGLRRSATISIEARGDGDGLARITISDNGCGMSEEVRQDAFRLYTTSKKESGIGFGLPLARKVVETEHRGTITIESRKGEGTKVTVVLPVEQEQRR